MDVADYILNGICEGCDQDPAGCFNDGKCFYDAMRDEEDDIYDNEPFRRD